MTVLDVSPVGYGAAARTVGGELAGQLAVIGDDLLAALSSCYGMGGTDDIGAAWSASYDSSAAGAVPLFVDLGNAAFCLAALLEQSGINYAGAEAACVPGESAAQSSARWAASSAPALSLPPSAAGMSLPEPAGWSMLAHLIGRLWPNGHQDLLRDAASGWRTAGGSVLSLVPDLDTAITLVMEQRAPEVDDATRVLNGLRAQLVSLASTCASIGDSCEAYAHQLDTAHSEILRECADFINTTVAAEAAGGLLAVVTVGASEVLAQGAVALAGYRAAEAIKAALEILSSAAVAAAADLDAAANDLAVLGRDIEPTLARSVQRADIVRPGIPGQVAPVATRPTDLALADLTTFAGIAPARATWADLRTLRDHFLRHGGELGADSVSNYAWRAAALLRRAERDGLLIKVDRARNTMRIYDPTTNTFGSFKLDGTARTLFKPRDGIEYWRTQRGQ